MPALNAGLLARRMAPMNSNGVRVAIIDYQMGNLFSVEHACSFVGMTPHITSDRDEILSADAALLPGVGAFGEAMANLHRLRLVDTIHDFVATKRPLLGICLGMQLLFDSSEEFGVTKGLSIIPGSVVRFPEVNSRGEKIRVPHMGWNRIYASSGDGSWNIPLMSNIAINEYMYFVHSYFCAPTSAAERICLTTYDTVEFCSAVRHGNVFAAQFHPEKSGSQGVAIYRNFCNMIIHS
jgi:glutamine amidotransferase